MHKALGRGLESLIPQAVKSAREGDSVSLISLDRIKPNKYQSRTDFNEGKLKELAQSIKQHGLAQPLLVTASIIPESSSLLPASAAGGLRKSRGLKRLPR